MTSWTDTFSIDTPHLASQTAAYLPRPPLAHEVRVAGLTAFLAAVVVGLL